MVEEMAGLLENFPGAANQTRCFLHILNFTTKSILHQFEIPPKKKSGNDNGDDDSKVPINKAMSELMALSTEIENDQDMAVDDLEDSEDGDDNKEGFVDERQDLSAEQITELEEDVKPVHLMLTKVRPYEDII